MLEIFLRNSVSYCRDRIASAAHTWCKSLIPQHLKDLVSVEAIWSHLWKSTHCHIWENSLRWFELCDMVCYPAGSSLLKMDTLWIKRWTWSAITHRLWSLNDAQLVLRGPKCAKKISPTPLYQHHQPELLIPSRMVLASYCLHQILTLPSECHSRNWDSSKV